MKQRKYKIIYLFLFNVLFGQKSNWYVLIDTNIKYFTEVIAKTIMCAWSMVVFFSEKEPENPAETHEDMGRTYNFYIEAIPAGNQTRCTKSCVKIKCSPIPFISNAVNLRLYDSI